MLLLFLSFGIWCLFTNIKTNYECKQDPNRVLECSTNILNIISLASLKSDINLVINQNYACLATTIFLIIILQTFRLIQKKTEKQCDDNLISPSDYTIMIENLRNSEGIIDKDLIEFITKEWEKLVSETVKENKKPSFLMQSERGLKNIFERKFEIKQVIEAFQIGEFINLERKKMEMNKTKRKKVWEIKKKLLKNNVKYDLLENLSKKYFEFSKNRSQNLKEIQNEFENELCLFMNKKKIKRIKKFFLQIKDLEIKWNNIIEIMEKLCFDKQCPISFMTVNYQERIIFDPKINKQNKLKDAEILCKKFAFSEKKLLFSYLKNFFKSKEKMNTLNHFLHIKRAPEPTDILWENLQFSKAQRKKFRRYSLFFSFLYMFLAFIFLLCFIFVNRQLEVSF